MAYIYSIVKLSSVSNEMFISTLDLFKVGVGPSSSHTMGPMTAAYQFRELIKLKFSTKITSSWQVTCILKGSLAHTGKGHATDRAILMGINGYLPTELSQIDIHKLYVSLMKKNIIYFGGDGVVNKALQFSANENIIFDKKDTLPQHPNGMVFKLIDDKGIEQVSETYFSIGGGFIHTLAEISKLEAPINTQALDAYPYPFDSAKSMLVMADSSGLSIAKMKRANELFLLDRTAFTSKDLDLEIATIWQVMTGCIARGLETSGVLPGGLQLKRRAKKIYQSIQMRPDLSSINDYLCAYAMAVNEENADGHVVVTAPTNGAAGVIPAVLYYYLMHENGALNSIHDFFHTAGAIGGLIKHRSSISGAEVGCQGEVGAAASMAAAGLCAVKGGTAKQVENAAEIALEHHLGMTCDPVNGLVQVPCIERNGFGAIKAYAAASLALRGSGDHFMPLDGCIEAMKQTGLEMSVKYKETSLGGLALSHTEC
jgi:L-serine dehydratase